MYRIRSNQPTTIIEVSGIDACWEEKLKEKYYCCCSMHNNEVQYVVFAISISVCMGSMPIESWSVDQSCQYIHNFLPFIHDSASTLYWRRFLLASLSSRSSQLISTMQTPECDQFKGCSAPLVTERIYQCCVCLLFLHARKGQSGKIMLHVPSRTQ